MSLDVAVGLCREGFEPEAAQDLAAIAAAARLDVELEAHAQSGVAMAVLRAATPPRLAQWSAAQRRAPPVFARSVFFGTGPVALSPDARDATRPDRVTPLADALARLAGERAVRAPWVEHPDTNEGKALSTLAKALTPRLAARLRELGVPVQDDATAPQMHVLLLDGRSAFVGSSEAGTGAQWPMGIPRLRIPSGAPSRSARKLIEAFVTFLGEDDHAALRPGMRAVDLGAAPGGWSWVLARRGLRVTAVDNGPLKGEAADDALIAHVREDGLRYRPRRPVDWLVCDIVESPSRIAALVASWIADGAARRAIFNLKLPMRRRYDEVVRCRGIVADTLARHDVRATLSLRQLYHDREEVTGFLARADHSPSQ